MTITPEQLVQREVIYCISSLVHELAKYEEYLDELMPVLSQDDWEEPAIQAGWIKRNGEIIHPTSPAGQNKAENWQEACEMSNLDPMTSEAFEHWIVSGWLADKLEAKGEMIVRDFLCLTIWGRATTGQMICADRVIEEICVDLNKAA